MLYCCFADAFEKFRNNSLKIYRLSPSIYLSAPALNWDAMLNMTKVEPELFSDTDTYLFIFQKGMRDFDSNKYSGNISKDYIA